MSSSPLEPTDVPGGPRRHRGVTTRAWWALAASLVALVVLMQWRHYPWQLAMPVSLGIALMAYAAILTAEFLRYLYRRRR